MRIFTAFPLDEEARRNLYERYAPVRSSLESVKWVAEENIHITLIFCGEMTEDELDRLLEALESGVSRPGPFQVEYRGIECFPPRGKPKVIYSRISGGTAGCIDVWSRMSGRLAEAGVSGRGDIKPYIPHITLGRIKRKGFYPRPDTYEEISGEIRVSSFGVFESKLTPEGPVYRIVQSYALSDKTV